MKTIGILKEKSNDWRVCLLPQAVKTLNDRGYDVITEEGLGNGIGLLNQDYKNVGASVYSKDVTIRKSDIVCSINHNYNNEKLDHHTSFIGCFNPLFFRNALNVYPENSSIYSIDLLPRTTLAQGMDVLSSQASLSGYKAVMLASNYGTRSIPMFTTAAGTIQPARVLVLGAGVAGLQAIATAKRLGATVDAFDVRSSAAEEVKSLGANFIEVPGYKESKSTGGYALVQSVNFQRKQNELIHEHAIKADIIITTANIPGKKAPILLKEKTLKQMKLGSVIVDLAAEQGGNCELVKNNRITTCYGVTLIGNSSLAKTIPSSASTLLSTNYLNYLTAFLENAESNLIQSTLVLENGIIKHPKIIQDSQNLQVI